jgi:hypothetical protein
MPRAADDFAEIRKRLEEMHRDRQQAQEPSASTTNIKGETIGGCMECQKASTPCNGACCD